MVDGTPGANKKPLLEDNDQLPLRTEFMEMAANAVQLSSTRIVRILLTTIDTAFLGHLGTKQLAGVALSAMWQGVPTTMVQFTIQAVTTLASQARGAGNNKLVGDWLQVALLVAVVGALPVMFLFWNVHYIVAITMDDPETVDYARQFSQMMMWSLLPQYVYVALTSYFSTLGVIMPATICTCFTVFANIFFNWFFIYGCGSFEGLGFVGSPLATVASSYLQLILFATYTIGIKGYHRDYWGGWNKQAISKQRLNSFLAIGIPTGLSSVVDWASGALAGSFSGLCGFEVAAGQNVLGALFALTYSTVSGFSTATQIRLARYLGEGKPESAQRILRIGSLCLLSGGAAICVLLIIFHQSVWQLWTGDQIVWNLCNSSLVAFMAGLMMAYIRFTLTVVSVSLGPREARINLIANNIASWIIYIPLAYLMPVTWGWGLSGFWWSDFYGEAFKVACLAWAVSKVDWQQASMEARAKTVEEDTAECENLEKKAFASLGAYSSPSPKFSLANIAEHSPGLLTRNAAENYEGLHLDDSSKYLRSPQQKRFIHIEDLE